MAYRRHKPPKREPNRIMQDTATPLKAIITNGTTSDFAIPCWYEEIREPVQAPPHNRPRHDHLGWPSPGRPDGSCQEWDFASPGSMGLGYPGDKGRHRRLRRLLDMENLFPIHLTEEGYDGVSVAFDSAKPEGLTAVASIDPDRDWVVRILFTAEVETAADEEVRCRFTVRAHRGSAQAGDLRKDIVAMGEAVILPAPLEA